MNKYAPTDRGVETGFEGVDIIGDIHGCAYTLEKLLQSLDYRKSDGVYWHASRKALFLGDIVDRGPHIREALKLIKGMVDAGSAECILGNHEFNALAYTWPREDKKDGKVRYLRPHNRRNNRLIAETLTQFASFPEEWRDYLEWFKTLPLCLEYSSFRIVHACWDDARIDSSGNGELRPLPLVDNACLQALDAGDAELEKTIDILTRGTSLKIPDERVIDGRDGLARDFFRTKFWARSPQVYQDVVFQPDPLPEDLVLRKLSRQEKDKIISYDENEKPVFFGHYWLHGKPKIQRHNVACLDYSAVKYGRLVAYRYDGESLLNNDKFKWVYVDPDTDIT